MTEHTEIVTFGWLVVGGWFALSVAVGLLFCRMVKMMGDADGEDVRPFLTDAEAQEKADEFTKHNMPERYRRAGG